MDPWNPRTGNSDISSLFDLEAPQPQRPSSRLQIARLQDQVNQLQSRLAETRMQALMDSNQQAGQQANQNVQQAAVEELTDGVDGLNLRRDPPPHHSQTPHQQVPMAYTPQQQQYYVPPNLQFPANPQQFPFNSQPAPFNSQNYQIPQMQNFQTSQFSQSYPQPSQFSQPPPPFQPHQNPSSQARYAPPPPINVQNQYYHSQYDPRQHSSVPQFATMPPHPSQRPPFQPPSAMSSNSQMVVPQPRFRSNIKFTGIAAHLKSFFQDFYQEIRENKAYFSTKDDKFKINWLSTLFEPRSTASYWFQSLLETNAAEFGHFDGFDDLKALEYRLPALTTFPLFLQELRTNFSDKNEDRTNRRNLDNC